MFLHWFTCRRWGIRKGAEYWSTTVMLMNNKNPFNWKSKYSDNWSISGYLSSFIYYRVFLDLVCLSNDFFIMNVAHFDTKMILESVYWSCFEKEKNAFIFSIWRDLPSGQYEGSFTADMQLELSSWEIFLKSFSPNAFFARNKWFLKCQIWELHSWKLTLYIIDN